MHPAQIEFAGYADRYRLQVPVQHVSLRIGYRLADRDRLEQRTGLIMPSRHLHRRLGRSIQVMQRNILRHRMKALHQGRRQRFSAAKDLAQTGAAAQILVRQEQLQHGRHEMDGGDAFAAHHIAQIFRVLMSQRPCQHQACAAAERPEKLRHRHIETERRLLQQHIVSTKAIGILPPQQAIDHRTVLVHHALGLAGRAGGVNHISQVARRQADSLGLGIGRIESAPAIAVGIEIDHRHRVVQTLQQGLGGAMGQDRRRCAIGQHICQPLLRIRGIERHISPAGLENGEQTDHHGDAALKADRNPGVRYDAQRA